jgi:hypothetical protein
MFIRKSLFAKYLWMNTRDLAEMLALNADGSARS